MPARRFCFALALLACLGLIRAQCPHQSGGLQAWSSWAGRAQADGANVTIPSGTKILLDVSPGFVMHHLFVQGELILNPGLAVCLALSAPYFAYAWLKF